MSALKRRDFALIAIVLPVWLACFCLHVYHVRDSGLAASTIFATQPRGGDGYPVLGGFRPDRQGRIPDVQVGERLVRVGDRDLNGVGYLEFDAILAGEANDDLQYEVAYERDGQVLETTLSLEPDAFPWTRIPALIAFCVLGVLVYLRSPSIRFGRLYFLTMIGMTMLQMPFFGHSYWSTLAYYNVFFCLGGFAFVATLRASILFPGQLEEPLPIGWSWVGLLLFIPPRFGYLFDWPIPASVTPTAVLICDTTLLSLVFAIVARSYRRVGPIERRQIKWAMLGIYLGITPILVSTLLAASLPNFRWLGEALGVGSILALAMPICFMIGILRFGLFDIDRLLSATAAYSLLLAAATGVLLVIVPPIANVASDLTGFSAASVQLVLTIGFAALVPSSSSWIRPRIDNLLFPDRRDLLQSVDQLLGEIRSCSSPEALPRLVGERLVGLFHLRSLLIYNREADRFAPAYVSGRESREAIPADSPIVAAIAKAMTPLADQIDGRSRTGVDRLDPFVRAALTSLDAEAIMPTHAADTLAAIGALGAKGSGDIYTSSDLSLLAAISERMGSQIARFDSEAKRLALERYVPGAVAERLAEGDDLESSEQIVTLLFVDIRGYTGYAHRHEADEVFSLINRYTQLVSDAVRTRGGSVVEFSGDGLMAVFGAPKPLEQMERAAVKTALEVLDALEDERLGSGDSEAPVRVGIGIATGPAFVGNIQTSDRMIWAALGDTTNLAARLQGLTRDLDVNIIIDDATRRAAGHSAAMFRPKAGQAIRGRSSEDIHVY